MGIKIYISTPRLSFFYINLIKIIICKPIIINGQTVLINSIIWEIAFNLLFIINLPF